MTRAAANDQPLFMSPAQVASRWACSERHIYNMISRGELPAMTAGGKLLRVRIDVVEAFECQNGGSPDLTENIASPGTIQTPEPEDDSASIPKIEKRPKSAPRPYMHKLRALKANW